MNSKQAIEELKKLGLTQTDIARLSGVTQPTISRIEHGQHESANEKTLNALLAVLNKDAA